MADLAFKQAELEAAIAARDAQRAELQALQDRYENDLRVNKQAASSVAIVKDCSFSLRRLLLAAAGLRSCVR